MRLSWAFVLPVVCSEIACEPAPVVTRPEPKVEVAPEPRPVETLDDLVRTINNDPSERHYFSTPSGEKLIDLGDVAIPRMLDLMLSDDEDTRYHAQHVLGAIAMRQHGFVVTKGWRNMEEHDQFHAFWKAHGSLDYKAPLEERERAVNLWRKWLASRRT